MTKRGFESPRSLVAALWDVETSRSAYLALAREVAFALGIPPKTKSQAALERIREDTQTYCRALVENRARERQLEVETWRGLHRDINQRIAKARAESESVDDRGTGYRRNFRRRLREFLRADRRFQETPSGWTLVADPLGSPVVELPPLEAKPDGTLVRPTEIGDQAERVLARAGGAALNLDALVDFTWATLHPRVPDGSKPVSATNEEPSAQMDRLREESSVEPGSTSPETMAATIEWGARADLEASDLLDTLPTRTRELARIHFESGSARTLDDTREQAIRRLGMELSRGTIDNEVGSNGRFRTAIRQRVRQLGLAEQDDLEIFWRAILENL